MVLKVDHKANASFFTDGLASLALGDVFRWNIKRISCFRLSDR